MSCCKPPLINLVQLFSLKRMKRYNDYKTNNEGSTLLVINLGSVQVSPQVSALVRPYRPCTRADTWLDRWVDNRPRTHISVVPDLIYIHIVCKYSTCLP